MGAKQSGAATLPALQRKFTVSGKKPKLKSL